MKPPPMKTIELSTATGSLAEYAHEIGGTTILLTDHSKPVAAIVSLKYLDDEAVALGISPELLQIIDEARREIAAGEILSLDEMKRAVLP